MLVDVQYIQSYVQLSTPLPSHLQTAKQSAAPPGAILGGSIGGAVTFLLLLIALWVYMRAKRRTAWSWLPPYDGTGTGKRHTRNPSSGEISEDILHITSARSRPSQNPSYISFTRISRPTTEDTEPGAKVIRDSGFTLPSLFSHQPPSSQAHRPTTSMDGLGREAMATPHTSTEVVVDGKLQFPHVARGRPASTRSDTVQRSASPTSMTRSMDTGSNEEVLSQLASLRAEIAGLRAQQEAQRRLMDAPPRYGEGI